MTYAVNISFKVIFYLSYRETTKETNLTYDNDFNKNTNTYTHASTKFQILSAVGR